MTFSKESLLNKAFNEKQFGDGYANLNAAKYIGKTSEAIKKCNPSETEHWREYFYSKVVPEEGYINGDMYKQIALLGSVLFERVRSGRFGKFDGVALEECQEYINDVVIRRQYVGFDAETTISQLLQHLLSVEVGIATDLDDRRYDVDRYVHCTNGTIGLQIKPETWRNKHAPWMDANHARFTRINKGKVFMVFYRKSNEKCTIIDEAQTVEFITQEILRLNGSTSA